MKFMYAFFVTNIDRAQTLQENLDLFSSLKTSLLILFSVGILIGLVNLLFYSTIKHSPDLTFFYLLPKFTKGKKNIFFEVEDDLGRPLNFFRITIFKANKTFRTYYFAKNKFAIYLPQGEYKATVSKFGYSSASTKTFESCQGRCKFSLTLKRTQEIKEVKSVHSLGKVAMATNILFAIALVVSLSKIYSSLTLPLQLVLLALAVFSFYLFIKFYNITKAIKLLSPSGQPLSNKLIAIANRFSEPIGHLETDKKGLLFIVLSPGIYRLTPKDCNHKSVRINETSFAHLRIKF